MDIDGIGLQNRPGDPPGGPFFAEDVPEAAAGTVVFGIVGGAVAVGAAGVAAVPIAIGITVGAGLYSGGCGIKALWNKLT